jgi:hypothetical protein
VPEDDRAAERIELLDQEDAQIAARLETVRESIQILEKASATKRVDQASAGKAPYERRKAAP